MISKISRQLIIFHIFIYSEVVEFIEITNLIKISHKTITRDLKELQNAGLINIRFSKKEKGYIHFDNDIPCPFSSPIFSDNQAKNSHIEKLIRLATIMIELRYHTELSCDDDNYVNQETCSSWYRNRFPNLSTRTMQRDFLVLTKIGYSIEYDRFDKCYIVEFPEGLEALQSNLEYLYGEVK